MANIDKQRVVTGEVRFSYAHLLKPRPNNFGGAPRYSVTVLIPKRDTATVQTINAAIQAAKNYGKEKKWGGVIPPAVRTPVHDGDGVRQSDGQPYGPECKGMLVINATSGEDRPPRVVDTSLSPIMDATEIYSGMWGRIALRFAPYNTAGNKGVGAYIDVNIQKTRDDEPLDNATPDASEDFGGAPQAAPQSAPQQNYGQQAWAGIPNAGQQTTPQQNYGQPAQQGYTPQQSQRIDPITGKPM